MKQKVILSILAASLLAAIVWPQEETQSTDSNQAPVSEMSIGHSKSENSEEEGLINDPSQQEATVAQPTSTTKPQPFASQIKDFQDEFAQQSNQKIRSRIEKIDQTIEEESLIEYVNNNTASKEERKRLAELLNERNAAFSVLADRFIAETEAHLKAHKN